MIGRYSSTLTPFRALCPYPSLVLLPSPLCADQAFKNQYLGLFNLIVPDMCYN